MKKIYAFLLVLATVLFLAACGSDNEAAEGSGEEADTEESGTITYESENGPIEVPANPGRVVVLATFAGNVLSLDVPLVGVDAWAKDNPNFQEELADVEVVTDEDLEKIIELDPDLIIGLSDMKNVDKLSEIAPVVTYTYGKVDYLTQHIEIGKLLNKEEEAQAWVDDFNARAEQIGQDIKAEHGEDVTVSVIESFDKQLYVFGDNWGRGTEILYQAMGLGMTDKVKEMALKDGYYALSSEVLPEYAADFIVWSRHGDADNSFAETETFKNIPAVKDGKLLTVDAAAFYFNDPITLDFQLDTFKDGFLGE